MFKIMGTHQGETEQIDEADTREKAEYMVKEYRLAFGSGWCIFVRKDNSKD